MRCNKETFETKSSAKTAASGHRRAKGANNWREYRCDRCGKWHLTSGKRKSLFGAPRKRHNKSLQALKQKFRKMKRK